MKKIFARREFLMAGACGAVAALAPLGAAAQAIAAFPHDAVEAGKLPRLLTGLCAYSFRKDFLAGKMTMEDFTERAVELKVDGVDMTTYYFKSTEPAYLAHLRNMIYRAGLAMSGVACKSSIVKPTAADRAAIVTEIKNWVDVTDRLGASHLRIFGGPAPAGATAEQVMNDAVEVFKTVADYGGERGIVLGIENHVGITQSLDFCMELMHRVNHPYAGINLDLTHFVPVSTSYAAIEQCIPYATNIHVRDHFDDKSAIDMDRVWSLFAKAGFKGYMSLEYEDDEPEATGIPRMVAKIRALNAKYSSV